LSLFGVYSSLLNQNSAHSDIQNSKPVVGIYPFQSVERSLPKNELQNLTSQVRLQFEQHQSYPLSRRRPLSGSPPMPVPLTTQQSNEQAIKPLQKQLVAVVQLVQAQEYNKAIPLLKKGIMEAESLLNWSESFTILIRMQGLLAMSYLALGQNEAGENIMLAVAKMQPNPPPLEFQNIRELKIHYERLLQRLPQLDKGRLRILGSPQATIYVNGQKRGTIPLYIDNLPAGEHYVRVEETGYQPHGQKISISENATIDLKIQLQQIPTPQPSPLEQASRELATFIQVAGKYAHADQGRARQAINAICKHTRVNYILTSQITKPDKLYYILTPIAVQCQNQRMISGEPLQLNTDLLDVEYRIYRALLKLVEQSTSSSSVTPTPKPKQPHKAPVVSAILPDPKPITARPAHRTWWFWTIIGLTAAGAATATTLFIIYNKPRITISTEWNQLL
jgi:hypothetical protein